MLPPPCFTVGTVLDRPENLISHHLGVLQVFFSKLHVGFHVSCTVERLPSGHSAIKLSHKEERDARTAGSTERTKTWRAPYTARSRLSSSLLTTLDDGAARGYVDVPQVKCAVVVHLCLRNAATWRNRPRLPSKACKLSSALAVKGFSAGQAASALHAMAILQVHQAKALKELHQGGPDPRLMQELRTATDFALQAPKVTAWSFGQVMSTVVVQEHHLWLNLAQMSDADKVRFLDAPISAGVAQQAHGNPNRQYSNGSVHQPTGWSALPSHVATRPPSPPLVSDAAQIAAHCSHGAVLCS
ncbi:Phosphatidylinositol 4-kinase pik1 [Labeo rohita]|uniref:Phosphatidylinositol 4-kinase pik1 n=1 Tax=Labeo rohita TaxID=84645 RepID=A0ABQ8LUA8_LABRO|nr:Phosphatidylinositol 4-kinase pik1 [Labeo rohita]